MATAEEVDVLKRLGSSAHENYTEIELGALIDSLTLNGAAAQLWRETASATTQLVDVSESGSSRKMSDVHRNALSMAGYYQGLVDKATNDALNTTRIKRIVRA
jgi:hypothetical protein